MPTVKPIADRFWSKVHQSGECWKWLGSKSKGYGQISTSRGKSPMKAHRLSWLIHNGDIPDGMEICHKCDNPECSNPKHLFAATHKLNMEDAFKKGRIDNYTHRSGENNNSSKLKKSQVIKIMRLSKHVTATFLAKKYKVCRKTITNIQNRKTWKNEF